LPGRKPFAFAGLWETWPINKETNSIYKSCTIITTRASGTFRAIHHRMPVILEPRIYNTWLDPANHNAVALGEILKTEIITDLASFPVSNRARASHPDDSASDESAGKPHQTMFDWPEINPSSPEKG
jgi:putative SOS response-associated peptidase YedK